MSVGQAPPQRGDPAALLLLAANTEAASARDSVVVVAIAFQWYKVPLLREYSAPCWGRHTLSPVFTTRGGGGASGGGGGGGGGRVEPPVPAGHGGSRRAVHGRFQARRARISGGVAAINVEVAEALRRLPNLHPQVVGGSALFWLEPGDSRIHQTKL